MSASASVRREKQRRSKQRANVYLTPDVHDEIAAEGRRLGRSFSYITRAAWVRARAEIAALVPDALESEGAS